MTVTPAKSIGGDNPNFLAWFSLARRALRALSRNCVAIRQRIRDGGIMSKQKNHCGDAKFEPLAVAPRTACLLLSVGNTRLYQLIRTGELVSYCEGRARRITMASIRAPSDAASASVTCDIKLML